MNRPSDWQAREQGRDPRYSYIVQAPAGSGKTELLTQRMMGLLARVENPEEVVAITFTRKAAAEMSHRLVSNLQAAAKNNDGLKDNGEHPAHQQVTRELAQAVLRNDAERGWNLLDQPSRLRIRTIDSLCSELARQLPVLSGLGGGHQIAVDADSLYRKAAMRTMAVIEDDGDELQADVIRVLDRYDNQYDKLVNLLTSMLGSREQWLGHLVNARRGSGFNRQGLEDSLRCLIEIQLKAARDATPDTLFDELPRFYNYALANTPADEAELKALLEASGGIDHEFLNLPTTADALVHWKTMIKRLLTADGKKWRAAAPDAKAGFPAPSGAKGEEKVLRKTWKDDFKALLDEYRENDKLREIYSSICSLPRPDYEDEAWESLESLMRLLLQAAKEWKLVLAETGEIDFSEIARRAIQSLGFDESPSDLALRMDYSIQHLLVDEFQDTSHLQIELLNKLTAGWCDGDGRTLFLVGDPMQSIYRFRKAEVSLFIKAWKGRLFDHIKLIPLQLRVNFRSNQPIVDWVNQIFPVVMPRHSDPVMGAVKYSKASTRPGVSDSGTVTIKILPERDGREQTRLQEAQRVIGVIRKCDENETVAILVRSRSHASEILAALDHLKEEQPRFRYQAIKFIPLAETPQIQDLVSLTLALIQPADRLAWLATLRAPFIGLELADLDELVAGNPKNIILDAIGASRQQRLQRAGPTLLEAVDRRGRQSVRSLIESAWIKLGGPACVENASELDDAATYFDLLESLEDENLPIDRDTLEQRMENLYAEPDAGANGNLQVITIYAAKGLQFDTVIVPGLNRAPAGDKSKLLHWFELFGEDGMAGEDRIVMSPMRNNADKEKQKKSGDLIKFISNIEKQRQALEDGRLLYVAATRAKHKLCLFAAIKPNSADEIKPDSRSLLACLWAAIHSEQAPLVWQSADNLQALTMDEAFEEKSTLTLPQEYRRLDADWRLPCSPEPVQLNNGKAGAEAGAEPGAELAESHDYIKFKWAGEDARLTGNLVHRLLQLIGDDGLEPWQAGGGFSRVENWCRQQLASEGVREQKADRIITRATRAINNCLASEQGMWILEPREESHCEYAISAVVDGLVRNMVLDRTFIENGTRWIIDYKTSSHSGGDLEGFLQNEAERYREQLQRYKNAMAIKETRPIRTALYFPLLDRFCEI